jgi:alanine racemase
MLKVPPAGTADSRQGRKRLARKTSELASSAESGSRLLVGPQSTPRPGRQLGWTAVHRSEITIDLGAIRHNARRLLEAIDGAELWAVVKANGYGHGATDVARAALEAGASALCVVTVAEAVELRGELPEARIVVMCPTDAIAAAREAKLELVVSVPGQIPDGIPVHLKLDTGMGRWGLSELPESPANVVGLMSHLATADSDAAFAQEQVDRFRAATDSYSHLTRHIANSAAALTLPETRFDAARCGIALYGISPFNTDPTEFDLRAALSWRSRLARVLLLQPGESTGYGRRFVAERPTWIGIVPVGYADGFRRDMSGTHVIVDGEPRAAVGTISMDAVAVELDGELPVGTAVTLVGNGLPVERHARVAGTIGYEIACGINSDPTRAHRVVVD